MEKKFFIVLCLIFPLKVQSQDLVQLTSQQNIYNTQKTSDQNFEICNIFENYQQQEKGYKIVHIQNLGRKVQTKSQQLKQQEIIRDLNKLSQIQQFIFTDQTKERLKNREIFFYQDTGTQQRILNNFNNFFAAFFHPYQSHGDILLVPDDIWLMISMFLSNYVNQNSQQLKNYFIKQNSKKTLTIIEQAASLQDSIKMEKQWNYFFKEIIKQIRLNTVENIVDQLKCDFSTTNQIYELISTSTIMSAFKKYFSYERIIMACGIQNVYFSGTRQDWVKLKKKLVSLQKFDVDGILIKYIKSVGDIIDQFLKTFDGNPNIQWWNSIMTTEQIRIGSGNQKTTEVQGWILHFYGIYQRTKIQDIPQNRLSVPITMVNKYTKTVKQLELLIDWVSISKVNQYLYKPDLGICLQKKQEIPQKI